MTYLEIQTEILERLNLTSVTDSARIGRAITRIYRKVTADIGLDTARRSLVQATATIGYSYLGFEDVEKLFNVVDRSSSKYRVLDEITVEEMRAGEPYSAATPTKYALYNQSDTGIVILLNCVPATAFVLYADAWSTADSLAPSSGINFPESYHDILIEGVLLDEYRKLEKPTLATASRDIYNERLSSLRLWMATSGYKQEYPSKTQKSTNSSAGGSSGSSSSTISGSSSWTQTGLITFSRNPLPPFAVSSGSAMVDNLDSQYLGGHLAAEFLLKAGGTMVGDILFTDGLYDIGKLGATRPRDIFASRNVSVGGTLSAGSSLAAGGLLGVTGFGTSNFVAGGTGGEEVAIQNTTAGTTNYSAVKLGNDSSVNCGWFYHTSSTYTVGTFNLADGTVLLGQRVGGLSLATSHASGTLRFYTVAMERGRIDVNGAFYIGDTTNVNSTIGLTLNQAANDDAILTLKSSDVSHGVTTWAEADSYCEVFKHSATLGGVAIWGFVEDATSPGVNINGVTSATASDTTKSTAGIGPVMLTGMARSGTTITGCGANGNLVSVRDNSTTRFILDADGDSHQDVGTAWTNFDSHDDIQVLDSLAVEVSRSDDPWKDQIRENMMDSLEELIPRQVMTDMKLVSFNEDGHHFVNMSKLTMLHTGAIRQLARENKQLRKELFETQRLLIDELTQKVKLLETKS